MTTIENALAWAEYYAAAGERAARNHDRMGNADMVKWFEGYTKACNDIIHRINEGRTVPTPDDFEKHLTRLIEASERGVRMTGYEFHKGGKKAYEHALRLYQEFKEKGVLPPLRENNGNPG